MTRTLLIGTRASALASTQTGMVRDALVDNGATADLHFVHTPGDASQKAQTPVSRIGVGVFTETLRNALAAGECDVAVHSFKDLPTAPDPRFIAVVPPRVDPREVLVSHGNLTLRELPTGAKIGTEQAWLERAEFVAASGTPSQVIRSTQTWFADGFLAAQPVVATELMHSLQEADRHCYAQLCRALSRHDLRERLGQIRVPVLAVAGAEDPATPPASLREIADGVPDGRLVVIEDAAHLACAEKPREVAEALGEFFAEHRPEARADAAAADAAPAGITAQADAARPNGELPERSADRDRVHAEGTAVRRQVLSDTHVDRAVRTATAFTAPFQDLISRYAWGEIWTRPGLDRPTRSAVTLTAMIAGQHWEEFDMHVRAARRNGVTVAQLQEILLQTAIYCSVPSANTAFARAQQVLREIGDLPPAAPQDPDHPDDHADAPEDERR